MVRSIRGSSGRRDDGAPARRRRSPPAARRRGARRTHPGRSRRSRSAPARRPGPPHGPGTRSPRAVTARSRERSSEGAAHLGVLHRLPRRAAHGRAPVLDAGDVRHARLEDADLPARDVAAAAAAGAVGRQPQPRTLRRHRAVLAQRAVGFAHRRPELDLPRGREQPEVPVRRDRRRRSARTRSTSAQPSRPETRSTSGTSPGTTGRRWRLEALRRSSRRTSDLLLADHLGVRHPCRAPDGEGGDAPDPR